MRTITMLTPTDVFPNLHRLYPNHTIVAVKSAFKPGKGWIEESPNLNVIAHIRSLRKRGYKTVLFELHSKANKITLETNWGLNELAFFVPISKKEFNRRKHLALVVN